MLLETGRHFSARVSTIRVIVGCFIAFCLAAGTSFAPRWIAFAQVLPSFDAASIRKSEPNPPRVTVKVGPENLAYNNLTLAECIERAYGLKDYQVQGPDWIESDRFVIEARTPTPVSNAEMMLRLQTLLHDRFNLEFHRVSKPMPAYALEPEGDHHGLVPSSRSEDANGEVVRPGVQEPWKRVISYQRVTMKTLAESLYGFLVRADLPVIDRTGLDGTYDFILKFDTTAAAPPNQAEETEVMTAVSKQLGIRVLRTTAPIEYLIVDHADRTPTGN